jgi:hypothetical protein
LKAGFAGNVETGRSLDTVGSRPPKRMLLLPTARPNYSVTSLSRVDHALTTAAANSALCLTRLCASNSRSVQSKWPVRAGSERLGCRCRRRLCPPNTNTAAICLRSNRRLPHHRHRPQQQQGCMLSVAHIAHPDSSTRSARSGLARMSRPSFPRLAQLQNRPLATNSYGSGQRAELNSNATFVLTLPRIP